MQIVPDAQIDVESSRFGTVSVEPAAIVEFPRGLIGLGGSRYVLLPADPDASFVWLQSAEDPALALPLTNPWSFFTDFEVSLSDADTARLGFPADARPDVWVTVRLTEDPSACTANLKAPILIHANRAFQVFNDAADAPLRAPLFAQPAEVPVPTPA